MPSLDSPDAHVAGAAPLPVAEPRLTWAETRALMRSDADRLVQTMAMPPTFSRRVFWFLLPGPQALFWYRIYRYAYLRDWRTLATLLFLICQYLTHIEIPPTTSIGRGCMLGHPPIVLCGRIGEHFTLFGHGGTGGGLGGDDIGGGAGLPVIGNDVSMSVRATVLGPVRVGDGARLGPACTVMRDVPPGGIVAAPPSRITRGDVAAEARPVTRNEAS